MKKIDTLRMAFLSIHSSPLGRAGAKNTGGMSTYLRGLSRALGLAGHKIDIFTRNPDPGSERIGEISPNVRLVEINDRLGELSKYELYPNCPVFAESIDRICRREETAYQLIFSHYWISGAAGRMLRDRWKIKHMVMFHTLALAKNEACSSEDEPVSRIEEERVISSESDRIIVSSCLEKEKTIGYYDILPAKVAVIPSGVDRGLFMPVDRTEAKSRLGYGQEKIILFVGRVEPVKGIDLLIQAAAMLPEAINYKLIIVGGDDQSRPLVDHLRTLAVRHKIDKKIIFEGLVKHEELPQYYNAADLTVLPSSYESLGLVALESIASGTPVVAGRVGIIPELTGPGDHYSPVTMVPDRRPLSWAKAIESRLSEPPLNRAAIDSSLAPFNWQIASDRLIRECRNLIDK